MKSNSSSLNKIKVDTMIEYFTFLLDKKLKK